MQISGSCCPFSHRAAVALILNVNVPSRSALFQDLDVRRQGTINKPVTTPGRLM
jgi:hypothetical protein